MLKTIVIKEKSKRIALTQQELILVDKQEYLELLHEVLVLRHKLNRRRTIIQVSTTITK